MTPNRQKRSSFKQQNIKDMFDKANDSSNVHNKKRVPPVPFDKFKKYIINLDEIIAQIKINQKLTKPNDAVAMAYYHDFYFKPQIRDLYTFRLKPCPGNIRKTILQFASNVNDTETASVGGQVETAKSNEEISGAPAKVDLQKLIPVSFDTFKKYINHEEIMKTILMKRARGDVNKFEEMYNDKDCYKRILRKYYVSFYKHPEIRKKYLYNFDKAPEALKKRLLLDLTKRNNALLTEKIKTELEQQTNEEANKLEADTTDVSTLSAKNNEAAINTTTEKEISNYEIALLFGNESNIEKRNYMAYPVNFQTFCKYINHQQLVREILAQFMQKDKAKFELLYNNARSYERILHEYYYAFYEKPEIRKKFNFNFINAPTFVENRLLQIGIQYKDNLNDDSKIVSNSTNNESDYNSEDANTSVNTIENMQVVAETDCANVENYLNDKSFEHLTTTSSEFPVTYEIFKNNISNFHAIVLSILNAHNSNRHKLHVTADDTQTYENCAKQFYKDFYLKPEIRKEYPVRLKRCGKDLENLILLIPKPQENTIDQEKPAESMQEDVVDQENPVEYMQEDAVDQEKPAEYANLQENKKTKISESNNNVTNGYPVTFKEFCKYTNYKEVMIDLVKELSKGDHVKFKLFYNHKATYILILKRYYEEFYKHPETRKKFKFKIKEETPPQLKEKLLNVYCETEIVKNIESASEQQKLISINQIPAGSIETNELNENVATTKELQITEDLETTKIQQITEANKIVETTQAINKLNTSSENSAVATNEEIQQITDEFKSVQNSADFQQYQAHIESLLPVSYDQFFKLIGNTNEILQKILTEQAQGNDTAYEKLRSDKQHCANVLRSYFYMFYLQPTIRTKYKFDVKPCPIIVKNKLLTIPKMTTAEFTTSLKQISTQLDNIDDVVLKKNLSKRTTYVFPVSFSTFHKFINHVEILNQICAQLSKGNEEIYKNLRENKEFCRCQIRSFYKKFYTKPSIRAQYKYTFTNATESQKEKLLMFATIKENFESNKFDKSGQEEEEMQIFDKDVQRITKDQRDNEELQRITEDNEKNKQCSKEVQENMRENNINVKKVNEEVKRNVGEVQRNKEEKQKNTEIIQRNKEDVGEKQSNMKEREQIIVEEQRDKDENHRNAEKLQKNIEKDSTELQRNLQELQKDAEDVLKNVEAEQRNVVEIQSGDFQRDSTELQRNMQKDEENVLTNVDVAQEVSDEVEQTVEKVQQNVESATTAVINLPNIPVDLKLPVSFEIFKVLIINCDEIVQKIIQKLAERDKKFETMKNDKQFCETILHEYYRAFYMKPEVRERYPYRIKACPLVQRENLLQIPEAVNVATSNSLDNQFFSTQKAQQQIPTAVSEVALQVSPIEEESAVLPQIQLQATETENVAVAKAQITNAKETPIEEVAVAVEKVATTNEKDIENVAFAIGKDETKTDNGVTAKKNQTSVKRNYADYEFPVRINLFKQLINYEEILDQIIQRQSRGDQQKYDKMRSNREYCQQQFRIFYNNFYLNPKVRQIFKYKFKKSAPEIEEMLFKFATLKTNENAKEQNVNANAISAESDTADRFPKLLSQRTANEAAMTNTTAVEIETNIVAFVPSNLQAYITQRVSDPIQQTNIQKAISTENINILTVEKISKTATNTLQKGMDYTSEHLLLTQNIFFKKQAKCHSIQYILRVSHGLKQRIWRAILDMSFAEFKEFTCINNADEYYQCDGHLTRFYRHSIEQYNWPINLYIKISRLHDYLELKGVPCDTITLHDVSPKLLDREELIKYTNFDECVRLDYYKRTGRLLIEKSILDVERVNYYKRCWEHDTWLGKTPQIMDENLSIRELIEALTNSESRDCEKEQDLEITNDKNVNQSTHYGYSQEFALLQMDIVPQNTQIPALTENFEGTVIEINESETLDSTREMEMPENVSQTASDPQSLPQTVNVNQSMLATLGTKKTPQKAVNASSVTLDKVQTNDVSVFEDATIPNTQLSTQSTIMSTPSDIEVPNAAGNTSAEQPESQVVSHPADVSIEIDAAYLHAHPSGTFTENFVDINTPCTQTQQHDATQDPLNENMLNVTNIPAHIDVPNIKKEGSIKFLNDLRFVLDSDDSAGVDSDSVYKCEKIPEDVIVIDGEDDKLSEDLACIENFGQSAHETILPANGNINNETDTTEDDIIFSGGEAQKFDSYLATQTNFKNSTNEVEINDNAKSGTVVRAAPSNNSFSDINVYAEPTEETMEEQRLLRDLVMRMPIKKKATSRTNKIENPNKSPPAKRRRHTITEKVAQPQSMCEIPKNVYESLCSKVSNPKKKINSASSLTASQALGVDNTLFNSSQLQAALDQQTSIDLTKSNSKTQLQQLTKNVTIRKVITHNIIRNPTNFPQHGERIIVQRVLHEYHYFKALTAAHIAKYNLACNGIGLPYQQALIFSEHKCHVYGALLPALFPHCSSTLMHDLKYVLQDLQEFHYTKVQAEDLRERVLCMYMRESPMFCYFQLQYETDTRDWARCHVIDMPKAQSHKRRSSCALASVIKPTILARMAFIKQQLRVKNY